MGSIRWGIVSIISKDWYNKAGTFLGNATSPGLEESYQNNPTALKYILVRDYLVW